MKRRAIGVAGLLALLATAALAVVGSPPASATGEVQIFPDPQDEITGPAVLIAAGPDGNMWFTDRNVGVGRITPSGSITTFPVASTPWPFSIAAGPDGNMWVTYQDGIIRRVGVNGTVTTFTAPGAPNILSATAGPDGNLWFGYWSVGDSGVGEVTPSGTFTLHSAGAADRFGQAIAVGADGNIWFTNPSGIGRATPDGDVTWFPGGKGGVHLLAGSDGNLWTSVTTEEGSTLVNRNTTAGAHLAPSAVVPGTDMDVPLALGVDGNVWFATTNGAFGAFDSSGSLVLPPADVVPAELGVQRIAAGPDGSIWFTTGNGSVGRTAIVDASFSDVSPFHPFFADIEWLVSEGVTGGFPDGSFRPSAKVTRASMAAFMYRLAGSPVFADPPVASFTDVSTIHQFFTEIEWLVSEEITGGFADGGYHPNAAVTRGAMAAFMHRLADGPGVNVA